jgi:sugar phosphate isomerase/epimerase
MYVDTEGDGTLKNAWQILVENTDPRWVDFQLDVGWATIGGEDPAALIEEFVDRIALLHVKDVADIGGPAERQVTVGQGEVDWAALFAASQGDIKYYVLEQDPPAGAFDPFAFAAESFEYIDCLTY